jgi:hypothetical protein
MSLANYEEVPDRIRRFFEKYPDGSLGCQKIEYKVLPVERKDEAGNLKPDKSLHVIYHALAYRTPDDKAPGYGCASEPIPGLTNYTRNSELMNAETSAWGRALVALGFVAKTVASANEIRAREGERRPVGYSRANDSGELATGPQKSKALRPMIKRHGLNDWEKWKVFCTQVIGEPRKVDELTKAQASALIDRLSQGAIPTGVSDVPSDDPPVHEKVQDDTLPFS